PRALAAQRRISSDSKDERIIEIADVIHSVGDEIERLENVVEPPTESLTGRMRHSFVTQQRGQLLRVLSERFQPFGKGPEKFLVIVRAHRRSTSKIAFYHRRKQSVRLKDATMYCAFVRLVGSGNVPAYVAFRAARSSAELVVRRLLG